MSYAQFHDGFYRNAKVKRAGNMAGWMWVASIGYANENLTDGFIPAEALNELSELDSKPRAKLAAKLVDVGLWEKADGGWMIHDFLKWNFTREQVLAKRAANLARVNKHRAGNGDGNARVMRYNDGDASRVNDGEQRGESAPSSEPPYLRTSEIRPPPTPPQQTEAMPPVQPPKADPVVVAAKPVDGDELLSRMASASKFKFDCMASDSIGRTDILRRLAAYGVDGPLADAMGILMRDPAKVWPWATSIGKGPVTIALLVGKGGSDGSKTGAMLASLVAAARDSLAAEAKRNARPVAPTAPARPLRPENIPGTPEYIAANERTRAAAQARIKALSASEESATAPASAVVQ